MEDFQNDIPKYQKKSNRQPPQKAKHKHDYKPCLLKSTNEKHMNGIYFSEYCPICGKIGNTHFMESISYGDGFRHVLNDEEKLELHKDLEIFTVNSVWDKYVAITTK